MSDQPSVPPSPPANDAPTTPPKPKRPSFNPRGRKPKLTTETRRKVCSALALGTMCDASAARFAGINPSTLKRWVAKGRDAIQTGATDPRSKKYRSLCTAMDRARDQGRQALEAYVAKGASTDPRVALEVLSRKYPNEWGRKLAVSGEVKHEHEHVVLSPQDAREALMRKLGISPPSAPIAEVRVLSEKAS